MKELTIFDFIKDILFYKKKKYINLPDESLEFNSFMLQRWCSMSDATASFMINETLNRWLTTQPDKQTCYKLLIAILPQQKTKKVAYLKKKDNLSKQDIDIKSISNVKEISSREVKEYLNLLKSLSV